MKETLTILFPKEISPEEIKAQIPDEGFLRMYGDGNPSTEYFNNPFKPHAIIKNFMYDEEEGWMGFVEVPEPYVRKFKTYNNPVIKAALLGTKGMVVYYLGPDGRLVILIWVEQCETTACIGLDRTGNPRQIPVLIRNDIIN